MLQAMREKRFAKRIVRRLLKSYSVVSARNPELSGKALYAEVLSHAQQIDPSAVEQILLQAEDSVDAWTTGGMETLGFRPIAHFFVMSQYQATGRVGTVVSFREIVYSLVPEDL